MAPWWSVVAVLAVAAQVAEGAQGSGRRVHNLYRHDNVLTLRQTAGCGLLSETHQITSSDGYVTTVFRAYSRDSRPKMPVILQHGFLGNSDKWFQLGNDSLPCLLAARQFDVWLTNSRGNTYSKKHVKYPTKYDEFWLFSFHEMAVRDVSATVDYILKLTKYAAVSYVGDGMGGTIGFALFSSLPGFNQKVNTAISVSPIAVISTEKDPIVSFVSYVPHFMERHFVHWTRGELPAYTPNKTETETETRTEDRPRVPYVDLTMEVFGDILETDSVDSTSYRTAAHVTQLMRNGGNFARFDYKALNQEKYGRDKPPNYDTKQITTRQLILYGLKDNFVAKEDVLSLCSALPAAVGECREIEEPELRHDDFLSHPSAKTHVYSIIVEELEARRIDTCLLASAGYDVWLPNSRGNSYSRTHSTYNTDTLQYWAFSFHEMAVYDLSATIDHVRSVTGAEKVSFVGHSLGATLMFVLLSVLPEYNKRVAMSVSLAPICFMGHTTSHLLRLLAYAAPYFEKPLNWMSNGEIAPFPDLQGSKSDVFNFQIGAALGEAIDFKQMLQQEMALGSESPGFLTDGTSLRTVLHLAQLITRGNFSWYDFGKRNSAEYKRPTPPNYNLRRITATQLIMYSDADHLVVGEDVRRLCSELPEGVGVCYKINKTGFQHSDFLSSNDAQEFVYNVMFGDLDTDPNEAQGKLAGSQIPGRATTLRDEDSPLAVDDEPVATQPGRQPVASSARGKPVFPMRGKTMMPKMQFRSPSPPEQQQQPAAPPVRGVALPPPEQDGSGSPPEEGTVPRPSEWEVAETTPRPATSSSRRRGGNSTARGRAGARGRIASRVRGMAAEPEAAVTSEEGGVAEGTAAPERKASAHPRVRGAAATAAPVPAAAASGRGAEEEADPTAPVKVCRYYATAGRLQRICYEEYV